MKIGFDAKRFFHNKSGLGNYSRDLVRILTTYYPENQYILYNPKPKKDYLATLKIKSVEEKNPTSLLAKKFKSLWRSFGINKTIEKDKLTLFHGLSGEIPFDLPEKTRKIVTIHDLIFLRYPQLYSFWDKKIHTLKFKYAAKKSDLIISISEQTKNDIIRFFNINPEKIKVIYQGCSAVFKEDFSAQENEMVKQKFNLPEKFLLNVGTIEIRKNALSIVKATKNNGYPLVLIGRKTAYYKEIEHYLEQNEMKNVIYISNCNQKELAIIYKLATVFIYPSIFEGFGIPIIEALYSKTPVITNKKGVFPEAGGPDSLYVDVNSTKEITTAIEQLWDNESLRKEISEKGFSFVQKFNDEIIAAQIHNIYK